MRTLLVYRRIPGTHEVQKTGKHENIGHELTAKEILERFGIREHLKAVVREDGRPDWVVQDFR